MRSYRWRDLPQGLGVYHYEVMFFEDGFVRRTEISISRRPLQLMIQDWMDGKPIRSTKEKNHET